MGILCSGTAQEDTRADIYDKIDFLPLVVLIYFLHAFMLLSFRSSSVCSLCFASFLIEFGETISHETDDSRTPCREERS
jgi:hypothetical protein